MIKKFYVQILAVVSLIATLLIVPASAKAENESTHEVKSDFFIKPSSGLDIKPDIDERGKAPILSSKKLPLSDNIDIGPLLGEPQKQVIPDKKHSANRRALIGITFHF